LINQQAVLAESSHQKTTVSGRKKVDESKKSEQNKSYYQRNKEKILEKAKLRAQEKVEKPLQLVPRIEVPKKKGCAQKPQGEERSTQSFLGIAMLALLALSMSSFLIHESAKFFASPEESWKLACFKAFILEGAAIAFSVIRGQTRVMKLIYKLMVLMVYVYGIWVVSGPSVNHALQKHDEIVYLQTTIRELEVEISKKEAVRDSYWKQDRNGLARKYDLAITEMKVRLDVARSKSVQGPNLQILQNQLCSSIGFRILIMAANFLCLQFLGQIVLGKSEAS
jgi:hypothetical protein